MPRHDGRRNDQLRPLRFERHFLGRAPGSVLASMGRTSVLCTCNIEATIPSFLEGTGTGWLTAEYNMLPGSTSPRKPRDRSGRIDGRSVEIQRLIGRSLRAVFDLDSLGERTFWIDCDVVEADGGTRTASINGAFLALVDAIRASRSHLPISLAPFINDTVAAVSVGLLNGEILLDLDYLEDKDAEVDLNLVMTGSGALVEVQAGGEESTFTAEQLEGMLKLGRQGIAQITALQREALGPDWPLDQEKHIC